MAGMEAMDDAGSQHKEKNVIFAQFNLSDPKMVVKGDVFLSNAFIFLNFDLKREPSRSRNVVFCLLYLRSI